MKYPKVVRRLCPFCKKHTEHKVTNEKNRGLNKAHSQSRGSVVRARARGRRRGIGNWGRFSRPPISKWVMTGVKVSKKTDFRYQCKECKKSHSQRRGVRTKRVEMVEAT
ncbi:MAG TPA: 50S ribosomal protein L44e [Candidatus Nanoarchaeia archaeon]|nr:50S ribosomal protein L44e [Candidatus Nanoarchaeia archaeon]